jgi:hypothetical protein
MPPWNRNAPDPFKDKRRMLAEQERLLAEQMSRLREELQHSGDPLADNLKPVEPPVWRMEDETQSRHAADPTPARKRNLARQRQRDMIWFFVILIVLVTLLVIGLWVAYVHNTAPNNGA